MVGGRLTTHDHPPPDHPTTTPPYPTSSTKSSTSTYTRSPARTFTAAQPVNSPKAGKDALATTEVETGELYTAAGAVEQAYAGVYVTAEVILAFNALLGGVRGGG